MTITNYVSVTSGSMPPSPNISATLMYGGTPIITLSNPVYSAVLGTLVGVEPRRRASPFLLAKRSPVPFRITNQA